MPREKTKRGKVVNCKDPVWEPLLELARIYVDDFMWMCEVELDDGTRLQAYKHCWTRRYLHLDSKGRAFVYVGPDRYQEHADLRGMFDAAVERSGIPGYTKSYAKGDGFDAR